jgi:hypothetical protein
MQISLDIRRKCYSSESQRPVNLVSICRIPRSASNSDDLLFRHFGDELEVLVAGQSLKRTEHNIVHPNITIVINMYPEVV